mgnify:CR=1 FL=1
MLKKQDCEFASLIRNHIPNLFGRDHGPIITGLLTTSFGWSFFEGIPGGLGSLKFRAPSTGYYDAIIQNY